MKIGYCYCCHQHNGLKKVLIFILELLRDIEQYKANVQKESDGTLRKRYVTQVQRALIKCQELGDDKLQVVSQIIECVENRSRQLHQDLENLGELEIHLNYFNCIFNIYR